MKTEAKTFAANAHQGQKRKNSDVPYITHPISVAERLERNGFSDELVCAGYLHDVVEDTSYNIEDIEKYFGTRIAFLVSAHTEDKSKSWQDRKQHTIDSIKTAEKEVKYLIIADRLENLLDLEKDFQLKGDSVWESFNAGKEKQKWYNMSIIENMYAGLADEDIPGYFKEYADTVRRVFG